MDNLAENVRVIIHASALSSIFDECDKYDHDETGGRLIGIYSRDRDDTLIITVKGVIEPGPSSTRSATSFFQDGEYQEQVFREIEERHPEIEHLGNWHTHHVNGYPTLSQGDRQTYHRIVNHSNHNTDFFYALLVTKRSKSKRPLDRYEFKNFIVLRNDKTEYEIPSSRVDVVDHPIIWPRLAGVEPQESPKTKAASKRQHEGVEDRALDRDFFEKFVPKMRSYLSKDTGAVYWRGSLSLIDDQQVELVVAEVEDNGKNGYALAVKGISSSASDAATSFSEKRFASAREAVFIFEREINRAIFQGTHKKRGRRLWGGR